MPPTRFYAGWVRVVQLWGADLVEAGKVRLSVTRPIEGRRIEVRYHYITPEQARDLLGRCKLGDRVTISTTVEPVEAVVDRPVMSVSGVMRMYRDRYGALPCEVRAVVVTSVGRSSGLDEGRPYKIMSDAVPLTSKLCPRPGDVYFRWDAGDGGEFFMAAAEFEAKYEGVR